MSYLKTFLIFLFLFFCSTQALSEDYEEWVRPTVYEEVDSIWVVLLKDPITKNEHRAVFFVRDRKIFAKRYYVEDIEFSSCESKIIMHWCDYGACYRLVQCDVVHYMELETGYNYGDTNTAWWAMNVVMTDLKQP